jgi:hypothetical protein
MRPRLDESAQEQKLARSTPLDIECHSTNSFSKSYIRLDVDRKNSSELQRRFGLHMEATRLPPSSTMVAVFGAAWKIGRFRAGHGDVALNGQPNIPCVRALTNSDHSNGPARTAPFRLGLRDVYSRRLTSLSL